MYQVLSFKFLENGELKLQGYASVFRVCDHHNDIVMPGAFTSSIDKHNKGFSIKLLWQHDGTKPIGVISELKEDNYGLKVTANVNNKTNQGRETIELIKQKAVDSLSIGFNVNNFHINKSGFREITNIDLWEVSVVTFPANAHAKISQLNSIDQQLIKLHNLLSVSSKSIFNL